MFEHPIEASPGTLALPQAEACCSRCGSTHRVIVDDGPPLCRICLMAWVWLAGAITSGETISEPDIAAMRHLDHVRPAIGCPWCRQSRAPGLLGRLDERPTSF